MLLKSVLTSVLLALSLGSEAVEASKNTKFGRLSKLVREPLEKAKHAAQAARHHHNHGHSKDGYRFLSEKTMRE